MHTRNWILALTAALLCLFILVNWSAITEPTPVSFLVARINAPLGLMLLVLCGVLIAVLAWYALHVQVTAFGESRRQAAELRRHRELADQAEQSRFAELQTLIEREFAALRQRQAEVESSLREQMRESANSLSAYIGEIEDKLERRSALGHPDE